MVRPIHPLHGPDPAFRAPCIPIGPWNSFAPRSCRTRHPPARPSAPRRRLVATLDGRRRPGRSPGKVGGLGAQVCPLRPPSELARPHLPSCSCLPLPFQTRCAAPAQPAPHPERARLPLANAGTACRPRAAGGARLAGLTAGVIARATGRMGGSPRGALRSTSARSRPCPHPCCAACCPSGARPGASRARPPPAPPPEHRGHGGGRVLRVQPRAHAAVAPRCVCVVCARAAPMCAVGCARADSLCRCIHAPARKMWAVRYRDHPSQSLNVSHSQTYTQACSAAQNHTQPLSSLRAGGCTRRLKELVETVSEARCWCAGRKGSAAVWSGPTPSPRASAHRALPNSKLSE